MILLQITVVSVCIFLSLYLYLSLRENRYQLLAIYHVFFASLIVPQFLVQYHRQFFLQYHSFLHTRDSKSKFHRTIFLNYTKLQLTLLNYSLLQYFFVKVATTACYKTVQLRSNAFGRTSPFPLCTYPNKNNIQSMQLHLQIFHIWYLKKDEGTIDIFIIFNFEI